MKKSYLMGLIALLPVNAFATDSPLYGRVDTGYSWSSDASSSPILGAGLGYQFSEHIRGDVTIGYRGWYQDSKSAAIPPFGTVSGSSDIQSTDGLVNAYYDVGHYGHFTPYVGGGIGLAYNHADAANVALNGNNIGQIGSGDHTDFAWQVGLGTAIDITPGLSFDVGYRYMDMGTAQTSDNITSSINGNTFPGARQTANLRGSELQVGLRMAF